MKTMIEQMLAKVSDSSNCYAGEQITISVNHILLDVESAVSIIKKVNVEKAAVPFTVIADELPFIAKNRQGLAKSVEMLGGHFLASGRTGNLAVVAAEDGIAIPGAVIATTHKNAFELGVLGAFVIMPNEKDLAECLSSGQITVTVPAVKTVDLAGKPWQWLNGSDVAMHMMKYMEIPRHSLLEFTGDGLEQLSLEERFSLARVLIDCGFEQILFETDKKVLEFLQDRTAEEGFFFFNEKPDSPMEVDLSMVDSMVLVKNNEEIFIKTVADYDNRPVTSVILGGDTACRFEDVKVPLTLVRYREINVYTQLAIVPGSQLVMTDLLDMGLAGLLTEMGAVLLPSGVMKSEMIRFSADRSMLGTSVSLAGKGAAVAGAVTCFCAAMAGRFIHPREMEMMLQTPDDHEYDN